MDTHNPAVGKHGEENTAVPHAYPDEILLYTYRASSLTKDGKPVPKETPVGVNNWEHS